MKTLLMTLICGAVSLSVFTSTTYGATYSNSQLHEQKRVIQSNMVTVLEEHVTLLQMILINRLEVRVNELTVLVQTQQK